MSHVPFVTITPKSAPLVGADQVRTGHHAVASTPPNSNLATSQNSRLPGWIGFPLAALLSFGLSAGLYSFVPDFTGYELATVSRSLNEPWQIAGLLLWKFTAIAVIWTAGLDYLDILSLSILAQAPYYVLLHTFYETSFQALGLSFAVDMFSLAAPFFLVRPLNFYNNHKTTTTNPQTVDELAADSTVQLYMSVFGAAVYSLVVYSSFYTWLPVYMIVHFDEVRSLTAAHNAILPILFASCVPIGYAAKNFLFKPSIAAARGPTIFPTFDPRTATLHDTFRYNLGLGRHSTHASVLSRRTMLLVSFTFVNTFVRVFGTVEGAEAYGAAGWAALWSVAAATVGLGFAWVGES